jgi:hypothetical protein
MHAVEPSPNTATAAGSSKQQQRPPSKQLAMLAPAPDSKPAIKVSTSLTLDSTYASSDIFVLWIVISLI